jgi:S1-C subfamily serine protease
VEEPGTDHNLGITYLTITPTLAAYYQLGVESGALVTEVGSNSIADKAEVKVGDVILSFNGARLGEGVPLLGMMRACHPGDRIVMEVLRRNSITSVELVHTAR